MEIEKADERIPAKLVFVHNKSELKNWPVLVNTDTAISEEEIICIYGKKWDIEVFFKSSLKLVKEYRGISYDVRLLSEVSELLKVFFSYLFVINDVERCRKVFPVWSKNLIEKYKMINAINMKYMAAYVREIKGGK